MNLPSPKPTPKANTERSVKGYAIVMACIFFGLPVLFLAWSVVVPLTPIQGEQALGLSLGPMMLWGVTVWLITGPLFVWYKRKGDILVAQQILIGSGIATLINVGCHGLWMLFGVVMMMFL